MGLQFAIDPVESMLRVCAPSRRRRFRKRVDHERSSRLEIPRTMLVMNGERFACFAPQPNRTGGQGDEFHPGFSGLAHAASAPATQREPAQRLGSNVRLPADSSREERGVCVARLGVIPHAGTFVEPAESEAFARMLGCGRAALNETNRARHDDGKRDEIHAIVLEHRRERSRVTAADVAKEARRDFVSRHIPDAMHAGEMPLEHGQLATIVIE